MITAGTIALILFITFFVLLFLDVPIAIGLGASALIALLLTGKPLLMTAMMMYASVEKFGLLSIPLFVLAGIILERGGISDRLIRLSSLVIGPVWGSLALVTVVVGVIFAGISGSGPADVAALGAILIPAMVKRGYNKNFAAGIMASAGSIAIIVPPSIAFIVYGVLAEVSIGDMFLAGIVPGLLLGIVMGVYAYMYGKKHGHMGDPRGSAKEIWVAFKDAIWGLMAPGIILGGIYGGIFTPEEAAGVVVVYGVIVGLFIYKTIKVKDIWNITVDAGISSAVVMFVVSAAGLFSFVIMSQGIAMKASQALIAFSTNKWFFLLAVNIILLIAGCFLDAISIFYITVPIFIPVARAMGIDLVHFGIIMSVNLAIGLFTPPVGVNLYVAANLAKVPLKDIIRYVVPFIIASVVALIIISVWPALSLTLPHLAH
ncbi:MAG TPA: TRAP transporter large permease [Symbiobacteriaceae bacterium]